MVVVVDEVDDEDVVVDSSSVVVVAFATVVDGDVSAVVVGAGEASVFSQATSASATATTDMALPNFTS
jgi:hypothetical protein